MMNTQFLLGFYVGTMWILGFVSIGRNDWLGLVGLSLTWGGAVFILWLAQKTGAAHDHRH